MISKKRELIEKAVIDRKGVWPNEDDGNYLIIAGPDNTIHKEGDYAASWFKECTDGYWSLICTRAEFDHVVGDFKRVYEWDNEVAEKPWIPFGNWISSWSEKAIKLLNDRRFNFNWRTPLPSEQDKSFLADSFNSNSMMIKRAMRAAIDGIDREKRQQDSNWQERGEWSLVPRVGSVIIANFRCGDGQYKPRKCEVLREGGKEDACGEFVAMCIDKDSPEYTCVQWIDEFRFPI